MEHFCHGQPVWDWQLTWDGQWPQFTQCFQNTVLVWTPCGVLWLLAPFYLYYLIRRHHHPLPVTALFLVKSFSCGLLTLLYLVQLINAINSSSTFDAELSGYVIYMATYLLIIGLLIMEKRKCLITSPVLFFFWLLSLFANIIPFYSKIELQENKDDLVGFCLFYMVFGGTLVNFLCTCFAETIPPGSFNTNGNLEVAASVLSRITYWWCNRVLLKGYKGLGENDLLALNPRDTTSTTVPLLLANLRQERQRRTQLLAHPDNHHLQNNSSKGTSSTKLVSRKRSKPKSDEKTPLLEVENRNTYVNGLEPSKVSFEESEEVKTVRSGGQVSVFRVLAKTFWRQLVCIHVLVLVEMAAVLLNPQIMRLLIQFTQGGEECKWKGYLYAVGMFTLTVVQSLTQNACQFYTSCLALRLSGSLTSAIYMKALTMNSKARRESTVGEVVNLMSVDARNVEMFTTYSFWALLSVLLTVLALYLLYTTVGVSMFAGLAFMGALFLVNTVLMKKLTVYETFLMAARDKRVKLINEVLGAIKILKLYAWEPSFEEKVTGVRNEELSLLLRCQFIDSFLTFAWTAALYWMTLFTFMTFVFVDDSHNLDASTSFVALSYFNIIRLGLNIMPIMLREGVKSAVSIGRINKFLNTPDLDDSKIGRGTSHPDDAMAISGATFSWEQDSDPTPTLTDISLTIKQGSLVAVVGQVGMGKSSLMSAMLGEMELVTGHVNINGSVAYVPQQAWIQNDTLRNNILFGRKFDQRKYDKVIEACALKPDLEILAAGDMTEIGEKGINLSGGQKQRVSVARAVYSDADVILLDDPLSAVDSHVGKHMFNEVISDSGLLKGKTRVLVTHGLQWLPKVDCIVVLSEGRVSEMGSYEELMSHQGPFANFLTMYFTQQEESDSDEDDEEAQEMKRAILERLVSVKSDSESDADNMAAKGRMLQRLKSHEADSGQQHEARRRKRSRGESESSQADSRRHDEKWVQTQKEKKEMEERSKLMTEEEADAGRVDIGVYLELARALGYKYALLMLVLFSIYNVAALGGNLWLSAWTDDSELSNITALPGNSSRRQDLNSFYLGIYGALGVTQTFFVVIYSVIAAFRRVHASRLLHRKMLHRLLRAPMAFFDTTPLGRIVNRFSQDMDMLDSEINIDVEICLDNVEKVLATVVAISYTTPIFLAIFAPAFIAYYCLMKFYIGTSCQIRRLQAKKRSPIYSHFGETLTGAHVIRAFNAQQRFTAQSQRQVDALLTCTYNSMAVKNWLGVRLDFLGALLILAAAILTVLYSDTLSAGIVGLSLSYALEITANLNMVVQMFSETETNIVSLERIAQYTKIDSEAEWSIIPRPKPEWPQHGRVTFQGYSTRYRPGLDLVLRDLTCDINPGEKVGIVGRTGAGKSSLTLALFRLIEAAGGKLLVDDVDIASLGLHDLRHKVNILPQDPVIFDGTIRLNLDPLEMHTDQQMWTALEQAHLKTYVQGLPDLLSHVCGEGGENLSVGQRQLLCLARALLRKTQILVLDEATAAVDMETDDLIQTTIREAFKDCTILTIAHRINTVMDYDRILVMDSGQMIEFDSPNVLLKDPNSAFYKMAKDAGLV